MCVCMGQGGGGNPGGASSKVTPVMRSEGNRPGKRQELTTVQFQQTLQPSNGVLDLGWSFWAWDSPSGPGMVLLHGLKISR